MQEKYDPAMDDQETVESAKDCMVSLFGRECDDPAIFAHRNPFVPSVLIDEYRGPLSQRDLDLIQNLQKTHDEEDECDWKNLFRKTEELFFGEESNLCGLKEIA